MAGFSFGTSRWDDIPATLGLHVEEGKLKGPWNGQPVEASFENEYDHQRDTYYHYTSVAVMFDPPLLLGGGAERGLDPEHRKRVLEPSLLSQIQANVVGATQLQDYWFADWGLGGRWGHYEGSPERYRGAFDALTHAANIVLARRAADPASWENVVRTHWPGVASAWGLSVDPRRYRLWGNVYGRDVFVRPSIERDPLGTDARVFTTQVQINVGLPAGTALSLARQDGNGFFRRLFRGQDVILGDKAFDDAYVVKGEPEAFVRAALGPSVRAHIHSMRASGYDVTLHDGLLDVFGPSFANTGDELDELLKRAFATATAFGPG